jgi:hypothetical protein
MANLSQLIKAVLKYILAKGVSKLTMKRIIVLIICTFLLLAQAACDSQATLVPTISITHTKTAKPIKTRIPTSTPTITASSTPSPTRDATQQTWYNTAIAVQTQEQVAQNQAWIMRETQRAPFPTQCTVRFYEDFSPNGEWYATNCMVDLDSGEMLLVQNKKGTRWILHPEDFLNPEDPDYSTSVPFPIFWSPDGSYLYFVLALGGDRGGDVCFARENETEDSLFRLKLSTGDWVKIDQMTAGSNGVDYEFSPTGRRYASTINGVTITDLKTGKTNTITTSGTVVNMVWSPDGLILAYSVDDCNFEKINASSLYIWNAGTDQTQTIDNMEGSLLIPVSWADNSTVRVIGGKFINDNWSDTIYTYSVEPVKMLSEETATPYITEPDESLPEETATPYP